MKALITHESYYVIYNLENEENEVIETEYYNEKNLGWCMDSAFSKDRKTFAICYLYGLDNIVFIIYLFYKFLKLYFLSEVRIIDYNNNQKIILTIIPEDKSPLLYLAYSSDS